MGWWNDFEFEKRHQMARPRCERARECLLPGCQTQQRRYVYGLWDPQIENVFYVGSTFYLHERFLRHLRENEYVLRMTDRGSFPILLLLLEFPTWCDQYSRWVEHGVALQLRAHGHYAFGDDIWCVHYADMVDNQARQVQFLREIWAES